METPRSPLSLPGADEDGGDLAGLYRVRHGVRQLAEAVRGDHVELVRERQRDLLRGGVC